MRTTMDLLIFGLLTLLTVGAAVSWAAPAVAPVCPVDSPLLAENFPVSAVSVSDDVGGFEFVRAVVEKTLAAQPELAPIFLLNVKDATFARLRAAIGAWNPAAVKNLRLVRSVDEDEIGFASETYLNWQQDFVRGFFDPLTGAAVPRFVSHYPGIGGLASKAAEQMQAAGFRIGAPLPDPQARNGYSGGNLETVGGVCLLGDADLKPREWESYSKSVCAGSAARLKVPTASLVAHHVDEIFKMIPAGDDGACGFALAFASPRKALEVMTADPSALAFDFASTASVKSDQTLRGLSGYGLLCGAYRADRAKAAGLRPMYKEELHKIDSGLTEIYPASSQYFADSDLAPFDCARMTNADVVRTVGRDLALRAYNRLMQNQIDVFKADLLKALRKTRPQCRPRVLDLPTLFAGALVVEDGVRRLAVGEEHSGYAVHPNPSNAIVVRKSVIFPEPYNRSFKTSLGEQMAQAGLKVDYIDTLSMHALEGDLHCSTQIFRFCQPAPAKGNP